MSNYYLKAILLKNCYYSINAEKLLKKYNINSELLYIDHFEKNLYKSKIINTFPQIYLKKYNSKGSLLLGCYEDLNNFINKFKGITYNEEDINDFINKMKWSKKATLRLIQLINLN